MPEILTVTVAHEILHWVAHEIFRVINFFLMIFGVIRFFLKFVSQAVAVSTFTIDIFHNLQLSFIVAHFPLTNPFSVFKNSLFVYLTIGQFVDKFAMTNTLMIKSFFAYVPIVK